MSLFNRLRPGLDPNDSTWSIIRTPADWRAGTATGLTWDAGNAALELAPIAQPGLYASWLPIAPVMAPDGTAWVADPDRDLLLMKGPCDPAFHPLPGIGGRGFATGRLHMPTGVAVDAEARIYIADTGNSRVQIVLPTGDVVAVLSAGLVAPVHAVIARLANTVAVHVFPNEIAEGGELVQPGVD